MARDNKRRRSYEIKRQVHVDPPRESWPGRELTENDVKLAATHKMDELTLWDRLTAHRSITEAHLRNYEERTVKPHWNFTLIIGRMGSGKSTLATIWAALKYAKGWPVYSVRNHRRKASVRPVGRYPLLQTLDSREAHAG